MNTQQLYRVFKTYSIAKLDLHVRHFHSNTESSTTMAYHDILLMLSINIFHSSESSTSIQAHPIYYSIPYYRDTVERSLRLLW